MNRKKPINEGRYLLTLRSYKTENTLKNVIKFYKILGFHGGDYEGCRLLGCSVVLMFYKPTFRRNVSPPSSEYKNPRARNQREQVASDCILRNVGLHNIYTAPHRYKNLFYNFLDDFCVRLSVNQKI
jgi:hypothetical protein